MIPIESKLQNTSNRHYTRGITSKNVTSGGAHFCACATQFRTRKITLQQWQAYTTPTVERYVFNPFAKRSENGKFALSLCFALSSELLITVRCVVYKYHKVTANNRSCGKSAMMYKLCRSFNANSQLMN